MNTNLPWEIDYDKIFRSEDENHCTPICILESECVTEEEMEANGRVILNAFKTHRALNKLFNIIDWSSVSEEVMEAYNEAQEALDAVSKG